MRMNAKELIAEARIISPTLPPAAAKLMSDMADRLDVQYAVIRESQAQLHAVVAENAALKNFISQSCYSYDGDGSDVCDSYIDAESSPFYPETTATGAAIAELHAEGIEQWIASRNGRWNGTTKEAEQFAAQLRQSVQVKGDK